MKKGYVVISMALVLLAITIGISYSLFYLSTGNMKMVESSKKGEEALFLSESCLEEGLLRLKNDQTYEGGHVEFPEGTCYLAISFDNNIYEINAYLEKDNYRREIESKIEFQDGIMKIDSWEEKVVK